MILRNPRGANGSARNPRATTLDRADLQEMMAPYGAAVRGDGPSPAACDDLAEADRPGLKRLRADIATSRGREAQGMRSLLRGEAASPGHGAGSRPPG
jgi:hypothetical protein